MLDRMMMLAALGAARAVCAATSAPDNAAIESVFRQTVEQSSQGTVKMKRGETCEHPKVQRFKILQRGLFKHDAATGRGFYPVTAEVDMRCGADPALERRWNGQLEIQLYQNSLNAWTMRW